VFRRHRNPEGGSRTLADRSDSLETGEGASLSDTAAQAGQVLEAFARRQRARATGGLDSLQP